MVGLTPNRDDQPTGPTARKLQAAWVILIETFPSRLLPWKLILGHIANHDPSRRCTTSSAGSCLFSGRYSMPHCQILNRPFRKLFEPAGMFS